MIFDRHANLDTGIGISGAGVILSIQPEQILMQLQPVFKISWQRVRQWSNQRLKST